MSELAAATEMAASQVQSFVDRVRAIREGLHQAIVGQDETIDLLLSCALTGSHALLVGVPGLAKTLMVKALAAAFHWKFARIQFTPDLMPADITGYELLGRAGEDGAPTMAFRPGPVFANLVLADEINRAAPKTQSALLEAMAEKHVTVGGKTYPLEEPFLVVATQNPIEQEGTYPLPEAQVDRFMLKLRIVYPSRAEERQILDLMARTTHLPSVSAVVRPEQILAGRQVINDIYVDDKVRDYIVDLVCATREPQNYKIAVKELIQLGASPRATISLTLAAKAHAFLRGRGYVTPQDVKSIALDVLRHRVAITYEAEAEEKTSENIIQKILDELPVP